MATNVDYVSSPLKEAVSHNLLDKWRTSLHDIVARSVDSFMINGLPQPTLQKIIRGLLRLVEDLERSGLYHDRVLTMKNIGYSDGEFGSPRIINWDIGVSTTKEETYISQLHDIIDEIAWIHNFAANKEYKHFKLVLEQLIREPRNHMRKSLVRSHLFLYNVSQRADFVDNLSDKLKRTSFGTAIPALYSGHPSQDFTHNPNVNLKSQDKVIRKLNEAFSRKGVSYGRNWFGYTNFMCDVYTHSKHKGFECSTLDLYNLLETVVPQSLLHMFEIMHRYKVLHKFILPGSEFWR